MTRPRMIPALPARLANLTLTVLVLILTSTRCANEQARVPAAPASPAGEIEIVGTLVSLKDDRPVDGGIELTLETDQGVRELVRVGSAFIAGPRDSVLALHEVVDAAKVGDRLSARGTRDETGALQPKVLELIPEPTSR